MKKHLSELHGTLKEHAHQHDAMEKKYEALKTWYDDEAEWNESDKLVLLVHLCDTVHALCDSLNLLHERHEDLAHAVYAHMCVYHGVCTPENVHEHAPMP
jgi:hypothetical protein